MRRRPATFTVRTLVARSRRCAIIGNSRRHSGEHWSGISNHDRRPRKMADRNRLRPDAIGTTKETKARKMLRSREGDVEHGIPVNPKMGRISFEDAADDILNDHRANDRRSLSGLERRITKHLTPFFKGRRLASITTADIRAYITKRKSDVIATGEGAAEKVRPVSNAQINAS